LLHGRAFVLYGLKNSVRVLATIHFLFARISENDTGVADLLK
jgi:hypothetical protein